MADTRSTDQGDAPKRPADPTTEPSPAQNAGWDKNMFSTVRAKDWKTEMQLVPPVTIEQSRELTNTDFRQAQQPDRRPYGQRLAEKEQGVLHIEVNFKGAGGKALVGSGFPINRDGTTHRTYDGTQLIGTADHVVRDRQKELYAIANEQFDKILATKTGAAAGNERISRQDLINQRMRAVSESAATGKDTVNLVHQFNYAIGHFNEISGSSRPNSTISRQDLQNFYDRNTEITVVNRAGKRFSATMGATDAPNDLSVLKVGCLSPFEQKSFGRNFEISRNDPKPGTEMRALGFNAAGRFTPHMGSVVGVGQAVSNDSQNFYALNGPIEGGMSGGPALEKRSLQVIGVNHATNNVEGSVATPRNLRRLLSSMPLEAADPSCYRFRK